MTFSETRRQEFPPRTPVSSPLSSVKCSANRIKLKINAISTLSNLIAQLSLLTTWHVRRHVAREKRSMSCTGFPHDCVRAT